RFPCWPTLQDCLACLETAFRDPAGAVSLPEPIKSAQPSLTTASRTSAYQGTRLDKPSLSFAFILNLLAILEQNRPGPDSPYFVCAVCDVDQRERELRMEIQKVVA